jgi:hypothetical protein
MKPCALSFLLAIMAAAVTLLRPGFQRGPVGRRVEAKGTLHLVPLEEKKQRRQPEGRAFEPAGEQGPGLPAGPARTDAGWADGECARVESPRRPDDEALWGLVHLPLSRRTR